MSKLHLEKCLDENIRTLTNLIVELSLFEIIKDKEVSDVVGKVRKNLYDQKVILEEIVII